MISEKVCVCEGGGGRGSWALCLPPHLSSGGVGVGLLKSTVMNFSVRGKVTFILIFIRALIII